MTGGDVRCPACREIDWYRDGLIRVERDDGTLVRARVHPAQAQDDGWSCMACGYEVPRWALLGQRLEEDVPATDSTISQIAIAIGERARA